MVRTRVGYAGGTKANPTYDDLGDHTETVQLDYDPAVISYDELLAVFWDSHNPAFSAGTTQYMSIIFYRNDEQKRLAMASKERQEARIKSRVVTEIRPAGLFYRAEDYHQKYVLRSQEEIMREFAAIYPTGKDFADSTAAARVNGYLDGYGTAADLTADLPGLGLSPQAGAKLTALVSKRPGKTGCRI